MDARWHLHNYIFDGFGNWIHKNYFSRFCGYTFHFLCSLIQFDVNYALVQFLPAMSNELVEMFLQCCNRNRKIKQLIASINVNRNNSLLIQAALWDNVELLLDLLQEDHDINCVDSWGRGPIHAAAVSSNSKCLQVLINAGADINRQCGERGEMKTALHLCAELGYLSNVQTLLDAQASFTIRDLNGMTPLDLASRNSHDDCMKALQSAIGE